MLKHQFRRMKPTQEVLYIHAHKFALLGWDIEA